MPRKQSQSGPVGSANFNGWKLSGLDYPSFRISLVAKVMDRLSIRELGAVTDLSFPEWRVLSRLAYSDGLTVGQIAEQAWVDRAEVSRAGASLERRGLSSRRDNPGDRRTPVLFLTAEGRKVYNAISKDRTAFHERVMADLNKGESEELDRLLRKIADRLRTMTSDANVDRKSGTGRSQP